VLKGNTGQKTTD